MANRVTMSICGTEYILVAEEDAAYMEKIGNMVDAEMQKLMDSAHMSRDAAAAYEIASGDWSSDVCSSDLGGPAHQGAGGRGKSAPAVEDISGRGQPRQERGR